MKSSPLSPSVKMIVLLCAGLVMGCGGDGPDDEDTATESSALNPWGSDPCENPHPTVFDKNGDHRFIGTDGPDVIVGTNGADEIWGNGGNDIICARGGDDEIHGGAGNDYIDGGAGNDKIYGDGGDNLVHGRAGGDIIFGGPGDDKLFGDLLDDHIYGEEGDDLIVGGHGADVMMGGPGMDWLRGDTNTDSLIGGDGFDVASFATATPPGQPQGSKGSPNPIDGVTVDLGAETASGDGTPESIKGIEKVIGSPFHDSFTNVGTKQVVSGFGEDTCDGQPCGDGAAPSGNVFVYLTAQPKDLGLVVLGTTGDDKLIIAGSGHTMKVTATNGATIDPGPGCDHPGSADDVVVCDTGDHVLRYVLGWGDDGDDTIDIDGNLPRDVTVHLDGGEGDDTLRGGPEEDVLFAGRKGKDILEGHGGDDALISESYAWDKDFPPDQWPGGGDTLDGGNGNDQLVVDYLCGNHKYIGGDGIDVAGFARSGDRPIHAQLGGKLDPKERTPFYGRAFNDLCDGEANWKKYGTHLAGDLEILEGSDGNDELHGNDLDNIIWGREGNDHIYGHGGDDVLDGLLGSDHIYGGAGRDEMHGGGGFDYIHAGDGERDIMISCGKGGGKVVSSDPDDPVAHQCGGG